ncbi:MAG: Drug resistance transporter EmrB/QacA subfamily [Hyphomicrobiales bacterium]|nr:Drug resistance transporter EmrB/QacA subfamily [Hyphomicrobiales bacterium]
MGARREARGPVRRKPFADRRVSSSLPRSPPADSAHLNKQLITPLIVACALLMENIDSTVISTSLPLIAADLGTDALSLKLAITSYLLSLAVFIPASGWVADRFGARNVFRLALVIFVVGSIMSGMSNSIWQMVGARVLQGFGGSMMLPVGRLIVLRSVPRAQMVAAFVWLTVPAMIGPLMGPPLGGFISTYFNWRWIFWINVPVGALGVVLASLYIDDVREENPGPFDLAGFLLTGVGFSGLVFGFSLLGGHFVSPLLNAALIGAGLASLIVYVLYARGRDNAVLDLTLLRIPTFRTALAGGVLFRLCIGALPFLLPLLLQLGFGLSPFQSGLLTFAGAIGALAMKFTGPWSLRTFGFRNVLLINGAITAAFMAANALFTPQTPHAVILVVLITGGFFRSLQFTALNGLVFADVENQRMSRATTMNAAIMQVGASAGVALGALAVELTQIHSGAAQVGADTFGPAFVLLGGLMLASTLFFLRLPPNAAEGIAGSIRMRGPKGGPQKEQAAE